MPRLVSLAEIVGKGTPEAPGYGHDEAIPSVKGKITAIYDQTEGTHAEYGAWTMQNLKICDVNDSSVSIDVVLKNKDKYPLNVKGKIILLSCNANNKGVKMSIETPKNKKGTVKKIAVTPVGEISFDDGSSPAQSPAPAAKDPVKEPAKQQPAGARELQPQEQKQSSAVGPMDEKAVLKEVGKKAHLLFLCLRSAIYTAKHAKDSSSGQVIFNADNITSMANTLYIDCHRQNLHTPLSPSFKHQEPVKPEPTQAAAPQD